MYASINAITVILFLFSLSPKKNLRQKNHRINYTRIKDEEFFGRLDQILRIGGAGILFDKVCLVVRSGAAGGLGTSTLTFFPAELLASSGVSELLFGGG